MSEAESKAQATKSQAETQAKNRMNQGRQAAQSRLGGVGLSMDGSYEAKVVNGSETIMRQTATTDDDAKKKAEQEAAKKAAEEALKKAMEEAQRLLAEMEKAIANLLTNASQEAIAEATRAIAAATQAVNTAMTELESAFTGASSQMQTQIAVQAMQLNGRLFGGLRDAEAMLAGNVAAQQEITTAFTSNYVLPESTRYYVFAGGDGTNLTAGIDYGNGNNQTFGQIAAGLGNQGVSLRNMMYLNADLTNNSSINNVVTSAVGQMNAVNQVDPGAEFVLAGHSRGANGVLALTQASINGTTQENFGIQPTFNTSQIKGIGVFDPSIPNSPEQANEWNVPYFFPNDGISVDEISKSIHTTIVVSGPIGEGYHDSTYPYNLPPGLANNGGTAVEVNGVTHEGLVNTIDPSLNNNIVSSLGTPPSTSRSTPTPTPSPTSTSTPTIPAPTSTSTPTSGGNQSWSDWIYDGVSNLVSWFWP